ncbi:MAG: YhbY family RNA-binding protein [Candidatus Heimdallarchaeota archaeon]|nr:MAG: YhbY family RNA-binding protein [Candidatus Heimdallarchaeota archaeon]
MNAEKLKELNRVRQEASLLNIGKTGISNDFVRELKEQLKKRKIIKIRILKNAPFKGRLEAVSILRNQIPSVEVVEVRGRTVIITEKRNY